MIPGGVERRSAVREADRAGRARGACGLPPVELPPRLDTIAIVSAASLVSADFARTPSGPALGATALVYYATSTVLAGTSPGMRLTELIQQRVPALFAVQDRRAHA